MNTRFKSVAEYMDYHANVWPAGTHGRIVAEGLAELAASLARAEVGAQWIPTTERKPTERGEYFIFTSTNYRTILAWNGTRWLESLDTINPATEADYWDRFADTCIQTNLTEELRGKIHALRLAIRTLKAAAKKPRAR